MMRTKCEECKEDYLDIIVTQFKLEGSLVCLNITPPGV